MRKSPNKLVEKYRISIPNFKYSSDESFGNNGLFIFKVNQEIFRCIVSDGNNWDHVSVSIETINEKTRLPTWEELNWIKNLFWDEDEEVIQIHPKKSNYINVHPNVLHLWRPQKEKIPMPPMYMV